MSDRCEEKKYEEKLQTAHQNNDQAQAAEVAQEYLEMATKFLLNIAITGETGSGKSTLVNALRGIRNNTEGAAPTGETETTMEPTEYTHPEMPNIRIWDLPGIGSTKFKAKKYVKEMKFEKYDFFIIVSSERFRENDATLAEKIRKMKKNFYFVRSKIDHNIRDSKEGNPNVKEEDVLNSIRNYCTEELQKLGFKSPKIFLVSGFRLDQYEFKDLEKTLENDLPKLQRDVLILALPVTSLEDIKQKKMTLESQIKWYILTSSVVAAVPLPGLSEAVDLGMIVGFAIHSVISLGLTPQALQRLSDRSRVPLEELKAEIKSPLAGVQITPALMMKVLARSTALIISVAVETGASFIPIGGTVFAMAVSAVITYKILTYILNSLAQDAERVFIKAWGRTRV